MLRLRHPSAAIGAARSRLAAAARAGSTLLEVVAVLAVVAVTAAIALPRAARLLDSIAVHVAIDAVASACALARSAAVMRGTLVFVTVDSAARRVHVTSGGDTLLDRPLDDGGGGRRGGFSVRATRTTIAYGPMGMGYGAANTTVIARQGAAADTLVTSRLGRVRK